MSDENKEKTKSEDAKKKADNKKPHGGSEAENGDCCGGCS